MSIDFNHFPELANALYEACEQGQNDIAEVAAEHVREHIMANGQVRTGEMLDSVSADGDTVSVGAPYAIYQNYGTRKMAARPFFEPALMQTEEEMEEKLASSISSALGGA